MNWKLFISRVGMMAVAGSLLAKDHPVYSCILVILWALNMWAGEPCEEKEEDADTTSNS
jgi:hypothetical protein